MAERGGFEPPDRTSRSTDFESAAFDHSATSPYSQCIAPFIGWRRCQQICPRFARPSSTPSLPHSTTLPPLHIHNVLRHLSAGADVNRFVLASLVRLRLRVCRIRPLCHLSIFTMYCAIYRLAPMSTDLSSLRSSVFDSESAAFDNSAASPYSRYVLFISSCAVVNQNFCFCDKKRRQAFFDFRNETG